MKSLITGGAFAAACAVFALAAPPPATAQLARPDTAAALGSAGVTATQVQWRRGWRGGPRYYRGNRGWYGPAAGFATGLLLGGALAAPHYYATPRTYVVPDDGAVAYCMRRFRSYDPSSGTYLGYDGLRHPCP